MIDLIKPEEFEMMQYQIETYAQGGFMVAPFSHILRFWNANKQDLFHLLGNQLQISTMINVDNDDYLEHQMVEVMRQDNFRRIISDRAYDDKYVSTYSTRRALSILIDYDILTQGYYTKNLKLTIKGVDLEVPAGMKVMRALYKIAKQLDIPEEIFEDFRLKHSQVLNAKTRTTKLTLSIHPLDFITMSDNACNWESCMSWEQDGDYRLGTVEMMNSPYILMAYLESENPMKIDGHFWNNKRWRQLFFVSPDLIFAIRPFPYKNAPLTMQILEWVRELAQQIGWTYEEEMELVSNYHKNEVNNHYFELKCDAMYNDIDHNHLAFYGTDLPKRYVINFSGPHICMICGEEFDYEKTSDLACDEHLDVIRCQVCGERIMEDGCYFLGDQMLCEDCYDELCITCDLCGSPHIEEDLTKVYLTHKGQIISYPILLCDVCRQLLHVSWDELLNAYCVEFSSLEPQEADIWNYDPDLISESFDND